MKSLRVPPRARVRLDRHPTDATPGLRDKKAGEEALAKGRARLRDLQETLYAYDRYAALFIFQAMDAAGKDGTIEHVMSGMNPAGCQVHAFKAPSDEELDHDFLWRVACRLPERGRIGVFNRSHYEEVLVVRVHPDILDAQKLPPSLVTKHIWKERFEDVCAFERHLVRNGTVVVKFFLHISRDEQRRRFLARLEEPEKHWKFSLRDVEERQHWKAYQKAYEEVLSKTSTAEAPWYVIPADHKWYARAAVCRVMVETLEGLRLGYPRVSAQQRADLEKAKRLLKAER